MHRLVPPGSFSFMSHFTESTHNEEQLPRCWFCCVAAKGKKRSKKQALSGYVQIYAPMLMASFKMKTEDNDWWRPMKATLKSRWQNQSAAELLSC